MGLGNPGAEFAGTRHNVGADAVSLLAARHGGQLKSEKGLHAGATTVSIAGRRVMMAVPSVYMNESGVAVGPLVRRAGLAEGAGLAALVVVHDELDLPSGRVKLKVGGGNAGHNGLKSIDNHLHGRDYLRVRIGIGKPPGRQPGADYVLKRPGTAERADLEVAEAVAADAVEAIASEGIEAAMNRFNSLS
ncbi:MAG TPA: aminoacyl-tRNA hydrolase [Acidimicrobiales bacterium]|nr:aminoacyl-tRNA hydrolase [Acidimicrobiales bacterium]